MKSGQEKMVVYAASMWIDAGAASIHINAAPHDKTPKL
jgi:hypothetical protein